jgi:predicted ester cyclase
MSPKGAAHFVQQPGRTLAEFGGTQRIAGRVSVTMTHLGEFQGIAATGQSITMEFVDIVRIAAGRVAERWVFLDRGAVLDRLRAARTDAGERT